MSPMPTLTRGMFDELVTEHQELIRLVNELELRIYRLGEQIPPSESRVADCQHAAGELIGQLRQTLFRHDQQVLPQLASWISRGDAP